MYQEAGMKFRDFFEGGLHSLRKEHVETKQTAVDGSDCPAGRTEVRSV